MSSIELVVSIAHWNRVNICYSWNTLHAETYLRGTKLRVRHNNKWNIHKIQFICYASLPTKIKLFCKQNYFEIYLSSTKELYNLSWIVLAPPSLRIGYNFVCYLWIYLRISAGVIKWFVRYMYIAFSYCSYIYLLYHSTGVEQEIVDSNLEMSVW